MNTDEKNKSRNYWPPRITKTVRPAGGELSCAYRRLESDVHFRYFVAIAALESGFHRSDIHPCQSVLSVVKNFMECRPLCGACCIAPSITSPIPGMPHGKPAGIPCVQLLPDYRCALFGKPERPAVCISLRPTELMCRSSRTEALDYLGALEMQTQPDGDACQP